MILHWFKYLLRFSGKNILFTITNIIGFSFSLACVMSIALYVWDEFSFDQFHENYDRIYRVKYVGKISGNEAIIPTTPLVLGEMMHTVHPDVALGRVFIREAQITAGNNVSYKEPRFAFADHEVFEIFTFNFIYGNQKNVFSHNKSVVISASLAKKLFGSPALAIGKSFLIDNKLEVIVDGVFEDWPQQTHLQMNIISRLDNYLLLEDQFVQKFLKSDWLFTSVYTYLKIPDGQKFSYHRMLNALKTKYADERVKHNVEYELEPLKRIHLHADYTAGSDNYRILYITIFVFVGIMILVMACINFISLSLATSIKRFRETSVRKILGADAGTLAFQYGIESAFYLTISMSIAGLMVFVAMPYLNQVMERTLNAHAIFNVYFMAGIFLVYMMSMFVTAYIPSLILSRVVPAYGMKGQLPSGIRSSSFIKALIAVQFIVSSILVLFLFVVNDQINFFKEKELGFQKENVIVVPLFMQNLNTLFGGVDKELRGRINNFKQSLTSHSGIESITLSSALPGQGNVLALAKTDLLTEEDNVFVSFISVDYDFLKTYKIPLIMGRDFSLASGTDYLDAYIINEAAIEVLRLKDRAQIIGTSLDLMGKKGTIIGVVKDFHFQGLQEPIGPLVLEVSVPKFSTFSIRINKGSDVDASVKWIESQWKKFFPERFFEYTFLESSINLNYQSQFKLLDVLKGFCMIALTISAVGLFSLAAYTTGFYTKEIGVRKISGAREISLVTLLMIRQMKIVLYAILIGFPIGFWLSKMWLDGFAYRISFGWHIVFFTYTLLTVVLVLSTVFHIVRCAKVNPLSIIKSD